MTAEVKGLVKSSASAFQKGNKTMPHPVSATLELLRSAESNRSSRSHDLSKTPSRHPAVKLSVAKNDEERVEEDKDEVDRPA